MRLIVHVVGRPAPEGSHESGPQGQVRHSSAYLPAWRAAVKNATYEVYRKCEIPPGALPLIPYPRPAYVKIVHFVTDDQCRAAGTDEPTGAPDVDKLLRATIDGLAEARVFANDSQVVHAVSSKLRCAAAEAGATIVIRDVPLEEGAQEQGSKSVSATEQYRITLERVTEDEEDGRIWETVILAQDDGASIADVWLPAIGRKLGVPLAADLSDLPRLAPAPVTVEGPAVAAVEPEKPKRTRRTKAEIEADRAAQAAGYRDAAHREESIAAGVDIESGPVEPIAPGGIATTPAPFNPFAPAVITP